MVEEAVRCLNQVACFLKVHPGKIAADEDCLLIRTTNHSIQKGFINIILDFLKDSQSKYSLKNSTSTLEETLVWQWFEYCIVYAVHAKLHPNVHQILKELNGMLKLKTYVVSNKLTIADIVLYYALYRHMLNLTPVEKESYMNVSRWFDNLQQDKSIRQSNEVINFSSNYIIYSASSYCV